MQMPFPKVEADTPPTLFSPKEPEGLEARDEELEEREELAIPEEGVEEDVCEEDEG